MRSLYILLLYLPSTFGKVSQIMTRYPYTHVALSLDDSYTHFYAFSRLRAKTPPISGYIEEKRIYYTLGENIPIPVKIYRVPVTKEGYRRVLRYLDFIRNDPEIMYNLIQMLLIPFLGGRPIYKAYHCGEFIAKVLQHGGIKLHHPYYRYVPKLFDELLKEYTIYEGPLKNISTDGMDDDFFEETRPFEYLSKTLYILRELVYRQIYKRASPHFNPEKVRFPKRS